MKNPVKESFLKSFLKILTAFSIDDIFQTSDTALRRYNKKEQNVGIGQQLSEQEAPWPHI